MKERICKYEPCNESIEGRSNSAKFCNRKCKNSHNFHKKVKDPKPIQKEISPMFLTRGKIHYAGVTVRGG